MKNTVKSDVASDNSVTGISSALLFGTFFRPSEFVTTTYSALSYTDSIVELAFEALAPYFAGDPLFMQLPEICYETFDFPMALVPTVPNCKVLELFGGPGASCSDFGARFIARMVSRLDPASSLCAAVRTLAEANSFVCAFGGMKQVLYLDCPSSAVPSSLPENIVISDKIPDDAIAVDWRNTAFILGLSIPFVYAALHDAIEADRAFHSKEVFFSNFVISQSHPELLEAVLFARSLGAPIGKIAVAESVSHEISDFLSGRCDAPESLSGLRLLFSDKELRESLAAWSASDAEIEASFVRSLDKAGYVLPNKESAACEAVRFLHFPVQQSIVVMAELDASAD